MAETARFVSWHCCDWRSSDRTCRATPSLRSIARGARDCARDERHAVWLPVALIAELARVMGVEMHLATGEVAACKLARCSALVTCFHGMRGTVSVSVDDLRVLPLRCGAASLVCNEGLRCAD